MAQKLPFPSKMSPAQQTAWLVNMRPDMCRNVVRLCEETGEKYQLCLDASLTIIEEFNKIRYGDKK